MPDRPRPSAVASGQRELGVRAPIALLPPIVLDRISTDWVLGPGNNLLTHYTFLFGYSEGVSKRTV